MEWCEPLLRSPLLLQAVKHAQLSQPLAGEPAVPGDQLHLFRLDRFGVRRPAAFDGDGGLAAVAPADAPDGAVLARRFELEPVVGAEPNHANSLPEQQRCAVPPQRCGGQHYRSVMHLGLLLSIVAAFLGLAGSAILALSLNSILRMLETAWLAHEITIEQILSPGHVPHFTGMDKALEHSRGKAARRTTVGLVLLTLAFAVQLASILFSLPYSAAGKPPAITAPR